MYLNGHSSTGGHHEYQDAKQSRMVNFKAINVWKNHSLCFDRLSRNVIDLKPFWSETKQFKNLGTSRRKPGSFRCEE